MGIEPALSAWESVRLRPSTWPDLRVGVSASDRERPLVAGANGTLMARRIKFWVLVALVLAVSLYRCERATLPLGVHPLAVGHPPGSGLGPAGEGGAHHGRNDLRPRGQVC
jgi:hypothetical protein